MKTTIIIFLLINSTFIFSQDQVVAGLPEAKIIYRNYKNKVQFAFTESGSKKLDIKCENCDTIYPVENKRFEYIIVPGKKREVKLYISNKKNKNVSENNIITFRVSNLPTPYVFFGTAGSGSSLGVVMTRLFVKYDPSIYLNAEFQIENWEISIDDKIFKGERNILNEEVINYLKNIQKDTKFKIKVNYSGMGTEGTTFGEFTLYEKSKQTEYKDLGIAVD